MARSFTYRTASSAMAPMEPVKWVGPLVGKDVVYKQVLTDPGMFSIIYGGVSGAMPSFHRRGMKQDAQDRRLCEDIGQMTGSPPLGSFVCDAGSLQELMAGKTLACPCCDRALTAEKLARLLNDVQRLATTANHQPAHALNGAGRPAGMIIDSHAHMISR